jgi:hypothetical protein
VGAEAHRAAVVTDFEIGVVVLTIRNIGQRVHERHGLVIIPEPERAADRLAGVIQRPAACFGQVTRCRIAIERRFVLARPAIPVFERGHLNW